MTRKKSKETPRSRLDAFIKAAMIFLELAGIGFGLYLTYIKFKTGGAWCDISATWDCSSVAASKYSVILGIPIAWLGVLTYIVMLIFTIMSFFPDKGRVYSHTPVYLLVISIWCVIYSAFLFAISKFVIKAYCINCIGLYVVNFGLFLGSWILSGKVDDGRWAPVWDDFKDGIKEIKVWAASLAMLLILVGSYFFFAFVTIPHRPGHLGKVDLSPFPMKGPANAPVQIVEFSDLKCPWCKKGYDIVEESRATYGDKYNVYFIHYPLDMTCNPDLKRTLHVGACEGAYATYCAQKEGKFWEYADILFANQEAVWDTNTLTEYATRIGLDSQKFAACLADPATKAFIVEKNIKFAQEKKITHTPTFYFNELESANITGGRQAFVSELQKAISAGVGGAPNLAEPPSTTTH